MLLNATKVDKGETALTQLQRDVTTPSTEVKDTR